MKFKLNWSLIQFTFKFTYIYRGRWTDRRRQCCCLSLMTTAATWRTSARRSWSRVWWASASALTSCAWCSGASSSTSTPSGAPSPTWSGRPRTSSLCPPLRCAANTSWRLKRLWLVSESYTCAYVDYLTCFLKEGYYLLEYGEIRSAEIINCGGRKNDYIDMTL